MPAPSAPRKFHTIHKFGKKRKKGPKKLVNASSQPPASRDIANEVRDAEREHVTDVTSTAASAAANSTERVRLDTPVLSVSEIIERKEKAEKRLEELSSTELNLDPSKKCMKRGAEKDLRQSAASESKRAGQDNVQKAMKKKHAGKMHTDYAPGGF
ncbi:hypothetical protein HPB47_017697 [Ixodes persulcatus]|uniref:Uncharacterized protein n=1 Tax=Ixodes persulcatus TaxID=34615 RepID=A0AC60R053_IXOPE|nr:hypothetical protein HPB47_017697 [Ixodes persulcatus]